MKLRIVSICVGLILSTTIFARPLPPGESPITYYGEDFYGLIAEDKGPAAIRNELFRVLASTHVWRKGKYDLIKDCDPALVQGCYGHRFHSYLEARKKLFGDIFLWEENGQYKMVDVYCEKVYSSNKVGGVGPDQIPDSRFLNAEHAWPQSHFTNRISRRLQKSDLHILYPVSSRINSSRSNLDFGEVFKQTHSVCTASKKGYAVRGSRQVYFEPPNSIKGDIARSIFYFAVRYRVFVPEEQEAFLRRWNQQDPVDDFERQRQEAIFNFQGTRNPFVDHSWLVSEIHNF